MRKPTICISENKGTDQLRSNCEADQHLCFRYMDSTIPLLSKSKISSLWSSSVFVYRPVCVGPGQKHKLLVFSRTDSTDRIYTHLSNTKTYSCVAVQKIKNILS